MRFAGMEGLYSPAMRFLARILFGAWLSQLGDVDAAEIERIERAAAPEYVTAIDRALARVDPEGEHPEWRPMLLRVCKREGWCGRFGPVGRHEIDAWAGVGRYAAALARGYLDPVACPEHRLADYRAVREDVEGWPVVTGWWRHRRERALAVLDAAPVGDYEPEDFSTRGTFGMSASRNLRRLGPCTAPDAMDRPATAALIAARYVASCERDGRACSCEDHLRRWVGAGRWADRPWLRKLYTLRRQCGAVYAARWVLGEPISGGWSTEGA